MNGINQNSVPQQPLRGPDPKVSFVTVCFRTPGLIRMLLKGAESAKFNFSFEYFLVDNAVGDGTGKMVRERFPWVKAIDAPINVGFGAGNNLALRQARGEYVMLVNPDLTIFPGEIEKLVEFMDAHPDVGMAGPALYNPDSTRQESCYRFPTMLMPFYRRTILGKTSAGKRYLHHYFMRDALSGQKPLEVDAMMGSAIMIRRKALEEIGMFDEKFFMYMEELDICRRAWVYNWRVVHVPFAKLVHYHQRESAIDWPWHRITHKPARAHILSAVYYFWKYRGTKNPHSHVRTID